jgi:cbb3-type cytochrome oxidase cytochrome c subunit
MKGIAPLFLGIFGTFAFSWAGLTLIPNCQIGHLDPQMDEEQTDIYPAPKSGMAERGRRIFAANGCVYCHSQQVRADYAASDIERKWGVRRSAPRDYIFDRPAMLGKMRLGPDLSNIGKRAPAEEASPTPTPAPSTNPSSSPAVSPASAAGSSPAAPPASAAASPASAAASPASAAASPGPSPAASAAASPAKAVAANSPAPAPTNATAPAAPPAPVPASADMGAGSKGAPPQYSAAWHHLHLYSPRSLIRDSNMPAYHFLYQERPISGERSAEALKLTGLDAPPEGAEVVPTYDAKCLVAYLMSLDQSHELKEAKLAAPASSPAPAKEAK